MQFAANHIIMSKGEAKCLLGYATKDASKINLFGVVIDLEAQRAWATDGQRATICCVSGGDPRMKSATTFMIPRSVVEQCAKHVGCKIEVNGDTITWSGYDRKTFEIFIGGLPDGAEPPHPTATGTAALLQVVPPPIHMVVPQPAEKPCAEVALQSKFLADLALLAAADVFTLIVRPGAEPLDAVLVRGTASPDSDSVEWTTIIMPMRV